MQLASILLTTTFIDSKSLTLLAIKYCNLDLFLLRNLINKLLTIILRITSIKIKDQTKKKNRKFLRNVIFNVDY